MSGSVTSFHLSTLSDGYPILIINTDSFSLKLEADLAMQVYKALEYSRGKKLSCTLSDQ